MIKTLYGTPVEIVGDAQLSDSVIIRIIETGRITHTLKDDLDLSRQDIEKALSGSGQEPLGAFPFVYA